MAWADERRMSIHSRGLAGEYALLYVDLTAEQRDNVVRVAEFLGPCVGASIMAKCVSTEGALDRIRSLLPCLRTILYVRVQHLHRVAQIR